MARTRECDYCGADIDPGTGTMFVRVDGATVHYCSSKCEKNADLGREARNLEWTEAGGAREESAEDDSTEETAADADVAEADASDDADAEEEASDTDADETDSEEADSDDGEETDEEAEEAEA